MRSNVIFVKDSLIMETNIIGYKKQGESILFFIKADGKICYSGLIDCYSTSNLNIVDIQMQIIQMDLK